MSYDKLSKLDQIIYTESKKLCDTCKSGDTCSQDIKGLKRVITYNKLSGKWILGVMRCDKMRGAINSYTDIRIYTNLIKNAKRKPIYEHLKKGVGIFMHGDPGHGKSYTLAAFANMFNQQGNNIYFDLANNITSKVWAFETRQNTLKEIIEADMVFIDDFGGEKFTEDNISICWTPIIKGRVELKKPTFISSNYSLRELQEKIASATDDMTAIVLLDRLKTLGVFLFEDRNYRR